MSSSGASAQYPLSTTFPPRRRVIHTLSPVRFGDRPCKERRQLVDGLQRPDRMRGGHVTVGPDDPRAPPIRQVQFRLRPGDRPRPAPATPRSRRSTPSQCPPRTGTRARPGAWLGSPRAQPPRRHQAVHSSTTELLPQRLARLSGPPGPGSCQPPLAREIRHDGAAGSRTTADEAWVRPLGEVSIVDATKKHRAGRTEPSRIATFGPRPEGEAVRDHETHRRRQ